MELFNSLFDDEILIRRPETPVANLVAQHLELRSAYQSLLAAFVVPDNRLHDIARHVPAGARLPVSVIITGGAGGLLAMARHNQPGVDIVSVEPALRDLDDLAGSASRIVSAVGDLGSELPIFVQLPYAPGWRAAVELIEAAGLYGKIDAAEAEPPQCAEQLSILIEADLPFKITTRLQGEWLALLTAVEALVEGASVDDAARLIQGLDHDRIAAVVSGWDQMTQARVRRRLRRLGADRMRDVITDLGDGVVAEQ
jgi:hypothetical protein